MVEKSLPIQAGRLCSRQPRGLSPLVAGSHRDPEASMSDYSIIQFNLEGRALRARDTARLHAESVAWLRSKLAKCDRARTIVVTHHAPSPRSEAPYHANSPLKPAFASDLDELVEESRVPLWIHGHR